MHPERLVGANVVRYRPADRAARRVTPAGRGGCAAACAGRWGASEEGVADRACGGGGLSGADRFAGACRISAILKNDPAGCNKASDALFAMHNPLPWRGSEQLGGKVSAEEVTTTPYPCR